MKREHKEAVISDLHQMMSAAQATFLINYKGMSVAALQGLRKNLRGDGSKLRVTKATLMRLAAKDIPGADQFADNFKDQVGLVFASGDVSGTAKQLVSFSKEHTALKVIVGLYNARMLTTQDLNYLASLPSREVLIGQLLGTMQAPMTNFVRILHLLIARLVYVLKDIERKQQGN